MSHIKIIRSYYLAKIMSVRFCCNYFCKWIIMRKFALNLYTKMFPVRRYSMSGIFIALISSVVGMYATPSFGAERPRLVLGIVIDGLDSQYLDLLQNQFGEGGFNRLMRDGVVISSADYGTNTDATASAAMIMTGAAPATSSVAGSLVYDREGLRLVEAMTDPEAIGNFTNQTFSPRSLAVSTISDEARIAGGGLGRVFGISPNPSQAVILAGHSGNAALWLNEKTGNWASSTYYKELPTGIAYRNRLRPLSLRLDTIQWTPLKSAESYVGLPDHLTHYSFRYAFPGGNNNRYHAFAASPMINAEITDLAGELIDDLKLGTQSETDVINLVYNLKPYDYTRNEDNRFELIDSYLRLDRDLERIFNKADDKAGKDNTLFYVAATPPSAQSRKDDEKWLIPYGEFSTKKAKSLLNMFLIAKFGNGDWITGFFNDQFFLNHKLISDLGLDGQAVRTEAAAFLEKMSGVNRVVTIDEILTGRGDRRLEALQRNTAPGTAGDLFIEVAPGWETVDDINSPVDNSRVRYVHRYSAPTAPVFILAKDLEPRTIDIPVDARVIAPTIARLLRIRSPNGASFPALNL